VVTQNIICQFTGLTFPFIIRFKSLYEKLQADFVASDPIQNPSDPKRRTLAPFPKSPNGHLNTFIATMIMLKSALPFASVCKFL
jgi:hypothetical protein